MSPTQILDQARKQMDGAAAHFADEMKKLRTGRAHPGMLDGVMVEAYGTSMPLIQVGSITVPEPQLLQITPFDPANLQAVAAAIRSCRNEAASKAATCRRSSRGATASRCASLGNARV